MGLSSGFALVYFLNILQLVSVFLPRLLTLLSPEFVDRTALLTECVLFEGRCSFLLKIEYWKLDPVVKPRDDDS